MRPDGSGTCLAKGAVTIHTRSVLAGLRRRPLRRRESMEDGSIRCTNNGTSGLAFDWNEFETMDLESAEGDELALGEIREFWDHYLPFIMSVSGDYAYLALCVSGDDYGSVVDGYASDFEGVTKVAASFD